jgi:peptidoglycan/xylan/chitin deacetylase (PgdA/CDA1 family)
MKRFLLSLMLSLAAAAASAQGIVVLEYHEVVSPKSGIQPNDTVVTTDQFNAQMKWLSTNGYYTITAPQLAAYMTNAGALNIPAGKKPIVITFDDGWTNQQNALPALRRYGFAATFNVIAGLPNTNSAYLTWRQIRNIQNNYRGDIQSHTLTHPSTWNPAMYYDEIVLSKNIIEHQTGRAVKTITWPNGAFNINMITYAIGANYAGAITIDDNWCTQAGQDLSGTADCRWLTGNTTGQNPYLIKRLYVDGRCTTAEFGTWVTQGHSSMCAAMAPAATTLQAQTLSVQDVLAPASPQRKADRAAKYDKRRDMIDEDNDGGDRHRRNRGDR